MIDLLLPKTVQKLRRAFMTKLYLNMNSIKAAAVMFIVVLLTVVIDGL